MYPRCSCSLLRENSHQHIYWNALNWTHTHLHKHIRFFNIRVIYIHIACLYINNNDNNRMAHHLLLLVCTQKAQYMLLLIFFSFYITMATMLVVWSVSLHPLHTFVRSINIQIDWTVCELMHRATNTLAQLDAKNMIIFFSKQYF